MSHFTLAQRKTLAEHLKLGTTYREVEKFLNEKSKVQDTALN